MITLTEYVQTEKWANEINEDIIGLTEGYTIGYDNKTCKTVVQLFDAEDKMIGEGAFDNSELAMALIEEYFDLDDEDQEYNDSYDWAENIEVANVEDVKRYIQRKADEFHVRIDYISDDTMFDDIVGVGLEVWFNANQNSDDLVSFVQEVSDGMMSEFGAQSYDFSNESWKISL